jgi:3-phenylpropionate/trans-cinnamate dioxygenase ferredoxin component
MTTQCPATFVRVASLEQVPAGQARVVFLNGTTVALFNVDGEICALDDSCPHAGSSLAGGRLEGSVVRCRAHGMRFDVKTGRMPGVDGLAAKSFPVRVINGEIEIGVA